jgi:hypothetical protein
VVVPRVEAARPTVMALRAEVARPTVVLRAATVVV